MNRKAIISLIVKYGGLQVAKFLTRYSPRIFMYHGFSDKAKVGYVSIEKFDRQLKILKENFNILSLIQLTELINAKHKVPKNTIVITIDDGYKNFYDFAYPLLKKYNIPATFFVTTGFINGDLWLWPDQLKWLLSNRIKSPKKLILLTKKFMFLSDEQANWQQINDFCLSVDDQNKLKVIKELAILLGIELPNTPPEQYAPCSWDELKEMQNNGIEIGGHTVTHPSLGQVTLKQAQYEIEQSRKCMDRQLGEMGRTFCYPNGQPSDYSSEIKKLVENAGYKSAVTAFNDVYNLKMPFAWRRFDGGNDNLGFLKSLYGIEMLGNKINNKQKSDY
jgi:peptidoglycan/xylan/chitin deacetylase (PgdA/CDA1 family)